MSFAIRHKIGALLLDAPLYVYLLCKSAINDTSAWVHIRNRDDTLDHTPASIGVKCEGPWTSLLHLPKVFPWFGKVLFEKAFAQFPIASSPARQLQADQPQVSFVIGHRGTERLPLLLKTLASIAAQDNCLIECVVVEQDASPKVQALLPSWVNYVFTKTEANDTPYSRAWAFNEGVKHAKSDCLILHDNDLIVPRCYARDTLEKIQEGYDFVNLKRFIFYLSREATENFTVLDIGHTGQHIESVMQNAQGGGSVGASRAAYQDIGGLDQRFIGWGGEDNEFWERALTKRVWEYGYLPLIHLWHAPQQGRLDGAKADTKALYNRLSQIAPSVRIAWLKQANQSEISQ